MQIERAQALDPDEIFTRRAAMQTGISGRALTKLVRAGLVARVGRGVYRAGTGTSVADPRGIGRSMHVAISHESAAAWLGADLPSAPTGLHVTASRDRGRRADCVDGVRLHRADLAKSDLMVVRGALVTAPLRTVLDVARSMPLQDAVAIGDSLCRLGLVTPREVEGAAVALPRGPGRPVAVEVAHLLDATAGSVFESISRVNLAIAGLPAPVPQLNIFTAGGQWIARVDFAWPECRLVLECDGFEFHSSREAFERDRRRWSALTRAGWRVAIVTWRDVLGEPQYLIDLVADLIGVEA
jgi:Transcriptional regulator, AbiEi antitoxin